MPPRRAITARPATKVRRLPSASANGPPSRPPSEFDDSEMWEQIEAQPQTRRRGAADVGVLETKDSEPLLDMINHRIDQVVEKLSARMDGLEQKKTMKEEEGAPDSSPEAASAPAFDKDAIRALVREVVQEMKEELRGKPGLAGPRGPQGPANAKVVPAVLNHMGLNLLEYVGSGKYVYQTIDGISGEHVITPPPAPVAAKEDGGEGGEGGQQDEDGSGSRPGSPVTVILSQKK